MCRAQALQSRVCVPGRVLGLPTPAWGGGGSFAQGRYGGAERGGHPASLQAPKQMRDSPSFT